MKNQLFLLSIVVILLSSCATSKKTTTTKAIPVSLDGITFTEIVDYKQFASILMPYSGNGFSQQESGSLNDKGEMVPTAKFHGAHISTFGNLSKASNGKVDENETDVNVVLEGLKNSMFLKSLLKKENVVEQYTDVEVYGMKCKRVLVSSQFTKGDYSTVYYTLGYIVPHNKTTAYFEIQKTKTSPNSFENHVNTVDEALKYMIATVKFRD